MNDYWDPLITYMASSHLKEVRTTIAIAAAATAEASSPKAVIVAGVAGAVDTSTAASTVTGPASSWPCPSATSWGWATTFPSLVAASCQVDP